MNPLLEVLEQKCKAHDWFYEYSDDHRVWQRGKDERHIIDELLRKLFAEGFEDQAIDVYNINSPDQFEIKK